ncbi:MULTISPECIES: hypothetical protein [Myxococcus]|nr:MULTISPECIES: hypothetical protein [Myxococcus]WAM29852.1 hypothetical protein OZ403_17660 [Myxococcus sp. NMCA1]
MAFVSTGELVFTPDGRYVLLADKRGTLHRLFLPPMTAEDRDGLPR